MADYNIDLVVARASQKQNLYLDVSLQMGTAASELKSTVSSTFDAQTIDFSNAIYGWGGSVYHGIKGGASKSASGALNRLSTINGLDDGVLSIKEQGQ
ncbi:MAG: hypothetical protein LBI13_01600 [Streptococcaceae bacterium]|nr:hypothetical protein [Streptococcaceae bacterium]